MFPPKFHIISGLSAFAYAVLSAWNALLFPIDLSSLQTHLKPLLPWSVPCSKERISLYDAFLYSQTPLHLPLCPLLNCGPFVVK